MLRLALFTPHSISSEAIQQVIGESSVFTLVASECPIPPEQELIQLLRARDPELILLDLGDWDIAQPVFAQIKKAGLGKVTIGFRPQWTRMERQIFEQAGIAEVLAEPFSSTDLERVTYEVLHRARPIDGPNLLAFLPAKAGSGCSTTVLNLAASLAHDLNKKALVMECDRHSGVFSILLNLEHHAGMTEALQQGDQLTNLIWQDLCAKVSGIDLLLANPARPGPLPSWLQYYRLLRYVRNQYDFTLVDLPEVINHATAEIVRSARGVFVVCEPELPSLKMAARRCAQLESCEISRHNIHILVNRWDSERFSIQDVEKLLQRDVFTTLPNDYNNVKDAVLGSRLVDSASPFGKACSALARNLSGLPEAPQEQPSKFALLRRLSWITG